MTPIDYTCNAIVKLGGRVLICEKPLGHGPADPDHQAGKETWQDQQW